MNEVKLSNESMESIIRVLYFFLKTYESKLYADAPYMDKEMYDWTMHETKKNIKAIEKVLLEIEYAGLNKLLSHSDTIIEIKGEKWHAEY